MGALGRQSKNTTMPSSKTGIQQSIQTILSIMSEISVSRTKSALLIGSSDNSTEKSTSSEGTTTMAWELKLSGCLPPYKMHFFSKRPENIFIFTIIRAELGAG